jgi:hypothetical protein
VSAARVINFWKMPPRHAVAICKLIILSL